MVGDGAAARAGKLGTLQSGAFWTWEAMAHGAEVVSYFRWRQAPFGQEQMHAGLQRPDGDWAGGAGEARRVSKELNSLPDFKVKTAPVALVFDYASAWAWEIQPQGKDFDYFRLVYDFYRGLRRLGISVDIVPPDSPDFGDRKMVLIPGLMSWTPELLAVVKKFKGQVILGPRCGSKTADFQIPRALPPDIPGFDCTITSVETLRPDAGIALKGGGHFQIWREFTKTGETVTEECMDGSPAVIARENTAYFAGWPDDEAMDRLLENYALNAEIDMEKMPAGLRRKDAGNLRFYMNYGAQNAKLILNGNSRKTHDIKAADIAVVNLETGSIIRLETGE